MQCRSPIFPYSLPIWEFTDQIKLFFAYLPFRSSRLEVLCKKGALTNFAKFTGKDLCRNLFFDKVASLRPATLLKMRLRQRGFPMNFAKFVRTSFSIEQRYLYRAIPAAASDLCWQPLYIYFTKFREIFKGTYEDLEWIIRVQHPWEHDQM